MSYDISVIIPVYNAELYIKDCLDSMVSSNAFDKLEIVIVDDGSKDGSGKICDSYSDRYSNIKTYHIENGGVSNARNIGLKNSSGKFITFCDADDYYTDDVLVKAVSVLEKDNPDLLFYDFQYEQEDYSKTINYPFDKSVILSKQYIRSEIALFMIENVSFNSCCNKFFRKSVLTENDICFKQGQKHGEDRDFVLKFLLECENAYYLPVNGYFYRYVKQSAVNKFRCDYFDNIYNEYVFRMGIYQKFDIPMEEVERLSKKSVSQQIISCTFFSGNSYNFKNFKSILKTLFDNKILMDILKENYSSAEFSDSYKKVAKFLIDKKTTETYSFIKCSALKEKIYKIVH